MHIYRHLIDSLFLLAEPLIKSTYPDINTNNDEEMSKCILNVTKEIQEYLNKSFKLYSKNFLNLSDHNFDIKQEVIARSGVWIAKKRYALWIINESGVPKDTTDYKGLDVVRSSFPHLFRSFTKEILNDILKNVDIGIIDNKIIEFKKKIRSVDIIDIASPTSVKNLKKYETNFKLNSITFGGWIKGAPAHVKAAISYNEFIKFKKLEKKYAKIENGEKIKWVYLKENSFGIDAIAFRGYDDPPDIIEFINIHIDREKIFNRVLLHKIEDFYKAINRPIPSFQQKTINKYFDFY